MMMTEYYRKEVNSLLTLKVVHISGAGHGEVFQGDSLIQISWQADVDTAGTAVSFELADNDGLIDTLGFDWDPDGMNTADVYLPLMPEKDDYRVRVVSLWDPSLSDESDQPFTITGGAVRVHAPNGGETWHVNTHQFIHWQSSLPFAGSGVEIDLLNDTGFVANLGFGWDPDGEGLEQIYIPDTIPSGSDYFVRITSTWAPEYFDTSDQPFTIINPAIPTVDETGDSAVGPGNWVYYR